MKIYLIRHGETDWNKAKMLQGREDIPLNDTGITQAKICGKAFIDTPIDKIISSPLKRAYKTAKEIGMILGISDVSIDFGLIEKDFGKVSGMNHEQREAFYKKGLPDYAESFDDLSRRAFDVIEKYAKENSCEHLMMVSHGAFIGAALSIISKGTLDSNKIRLINTSINILDYTNGTLSISQYNISPDDFALLRK